MGLNITKEAPNRYLLDIRVRRFGREIRKRETFSGTKAQAEERFLQLKKDIRLGISSSTPSFSAPEKFGDLLNIYRERRQALGGLDKTRWDTLHRDLGQVPLTLFPDRFQDYITHLRKFPSRKTGKLLANATLNRYVTMAKACYNLAVELEILEKSPLTKTRFPKLKEIPRDKILSEVESQRLLNVIRQNAPHLEAIYRFAFQVPCRKSELVNMRKEDLDLFNNAIRVRNGTTKNDQGCWKPLPPDMVDYFRTLPSDCPYLFFRAVKAGYRPLGDFKKAWWRCLKLAGVSDFRFHDTRHISATNLLDNGTPEQVVITVAGWKSNMLKTYYHRSGKRALELIRFGSGSGHFVDTSDIEATAKR